MSCLHRFCGYAYCENCEQDAVALLVAAHGKLERGARAALGFLINGQRADAEKALRAALDHVTNDDDSKQLTLDTTEAP